MYVKLVVSALILIALLISAFQNREMFDLRFLLWDFRLPATALVLYSAVAGAAFVAVLALPGLVRGRIRIKKLDKEICGLREAYMSDQGEQQPAGQEPSKRAKVSAA